MSLIQRIITYIKEKIRITLPRISLRGVENCISHIYIFVLNYFCQNDCLTTTTVVSLRTQKNVNYQFIAFNNHFLQLLVQSVYINSGGILVLIHPVFSSIEFLPFPLLSVAQFSFGLGVGRRENIQIV